ncbi:halocyanin domain-containing protein [Natronomonas sp. CBA1123]|uniref:halocyanin domain-containing protein n=1 Tax=Natronomonas sp. CBA1123 TaxID=2668070 RepID=UPI0012E9B2C2|nr:halocyanin domain-containing protein [Natronomonas sp. CBA1123]MUV85495.1 halocyanin domain-containing protein [Natronomonas sp. CBA1123]
MSTNDTSGVSRRDFVRVTAGATAAAAAASTSATTAYAQEEFDYGGWFEGVPNFEGTVDRTGEDEVRVIVGPGGDLVFDPPAIHVDPGTTVVWEWDQGFHNVVEKESGERYGSELADTTGTTYSVTFESDGISTYVCEPHETQGMKGAVAVGSGEGTPDITEGEMGMADGGDSGGGGSGDGSGEGGDGENGGSDGDGGNGEGGDGSGGDGSGLPGNDVLALYGIALVLAFLSPIALVVLMLRQGQDEPEY